MVRVLTHSTPKRSAKGDREKKVLFGLIEYYIQHGKPVGSATLKEAGFDDLSSATLRNYFANLEDAGYLVQQHASGGRIPTPLAFKVYAQEMLDKGVVDAKTMKEIHALGQIETKEVLKALQTIAEELSRLSSLATFITLPRFDHDTILDVKVLTIDQNRLLVALVTDFGQIQTETLFSEKPLHTFGAKRIESYFKSRLLNLPRPENLEPEEEKIALKFYNEAMVRYLVGSAHNWEDKIFKTGFSKLLNYPEFHDASVLGASLALFENDQTLRLICKDGMKHNSIRLWVGNDLTTYSSRSSDLSLITIPYHINHRPAGVIGVIGPTRLPYKELIGKLHAISESASHLLTHNLYKFKISLKNAFFLNGPEFKLLENKGKK